jgi:hypothetical protein
MPPLGSILSQYNLDPTFTNYFFKINITLFKINITVFNVNITFLKNNITLCKIQSRDSSVGIALGYGVDSRVLEFDSRLGLGIFLFTTASKTALGPTQPPIQCVPGALSLGVKRPEREADHSPQSNAEVKK